MLPLPALRRRGGGITRPPNYATTNVKSQVLDG